nr:immunoglobulin light chain junction region [Macaca mulatta]MOV65920.1 immunoglobulin light chain junction region [Macaca mulatta]MOV66048.1 immunoglobulin light chain junction region [Macaca mulatta]MOV66073.1 immunoglobulin light chain junction region [Macaca mulatta]MOV66227.1 immunoglobulin light chain junction region [Macaca mulatta]
DYYCALWHSSASCIF